MEGKGWVWRNVTTSYQPAMGSPSTIVPPRDEVVPLEDGDIGAVEAAPGFVWLFGFGFGDATLRNTG